MLQFSSVCFNVFLLCLAMPGFDCLLIYKYETKYTATWSDKGSGAKEDVAIWKPIDQRFFALGDILEKSYDYPTKKVMMVLDKGDGLVSPPISFTSMWNDRGSGAPQDVEIYRMNPKPGYVCLGHVAVNVYSTQPDKNAYRCVRSDLVTRGISFSGWSSKGSGAKIAMSLWNVVPNPLEPEGMETGLFMTGSDWTTGPSSSPFVIYSSMATMTETVPNADPTLSVYETTDVKLVWNDKGSGASLDVSFWRPNTDSFSLGDVVSMGYNPSPAFYAKEIKSNSLAKPTDFDRIWWNKNGRGQRVSVWRPKCPQGFAAVGHIANPSFDKPSVEDIRCVNSTLVTIGKWNRMWDDKGSGASEDCTVYRADASNENAVGVSAMGAVKNYGPMENDAYVLKREKVKLYWGKRPTKYEITNIVYDFINKISSSMTPIPLTARSIVNNCASGSGPDLTTTRQLTFTTESESTWSHSVTVDVGVSVSITAGVPAIASATVTASLNIAATTGSEQRKMESKQDMMSVSANVPAGTQLAFYVSGKNYRAEIPWTGDLITTYQDGTTETSKTSGVYKGSQVSEFETVREKPTPCSTSV